MERICCILTRRNYYRTLAVHCFKCFSTRHSAKPANVFVLAGKSSELSFCRHFKTFSRSLIVDKSKLERKKDDIQRVDDDFYGFQGSGIEIDDDPSIDPLVKYGEWFKRELKPDEEKVYVVSYGEVRLDNDNLPSYSSSAVLEQDYEFEEELRPQNQLESVENDKNAFEEAKNWSQVTENDQNSAEELEKRSELNVRDQNAFRERKNSSQMIESDPNLAPGFQNWSTLTEIDQNSTLERKNWPQIPENDRIVPSQRKNESKLSENDLNDLLNDQYFSEITKPLAKEPEKPKMPHNYIEEQYFGEVSAETDRNSPTRGATRAEMPSVNGFEPVFDAKDAIARSGESESGRVPENGDKTVKKYESMTAFDYVLKMRAKRAISDANVSNEDKEEPIREGSGGLGSVENAHSVFKLDSKGFRIYKDQLKDLENETEMDVFHRLKNSVLYNENDIVAITKPYGLQIHPGSGHRHSLTKYLPQLAKFVSRGVSEPELYTVHRLDIDTTGVLLLAKTQEMAKHLHDLLAVGKIGKTYWALTKGVPSLSEGIVDIPMAEGSVDGKARMVLRPVVAEKEAKLLIPKYSGKTQRAITSYHVLSANGNSALVELKPTTGVKHQLRVHLAFALGCPVLGDHKYSHLSKLAPQKLPSDILQRLHIRQSKVRYLPMHLHSRAVSIPDVVEGRDVVIGARLPKHFKQTMERLKIRHKSSTTTT